MTCIKSHRDAVVTTSDHTPRTKPCGCVYIPIRHGRIPIAIVNACRSHTVARYGLDGLRGRYSGHQNCCDLVQLRAAMRRFNWTAYDLALGASMYEEAMRTYIADLIAILESEKIAA